MSGSSRIISLLGDSANNHVSEKIILEDECKSEDLVQNMPMITENNSLVQREEPKEIV